MGIKVLELLSKKALSVARGLAIQGLEELRKFADLEDSSVLKDRRIADFKAEREALRNELGVAKREAKKALKDVDVARDEAEELKLELLQKDKEFELRLDEGKKKPRRSSKPPRTVTVKGGIYLGGLLSRLQRGQGLSLIEAP